MYEGGELAQNKGHIWTQCLKALQQPFVLDHINGFEFSQFCVQSLSYFPLLKKGTTAEFPASVSSNNRPCSQPILLAGLMHFYHCLVN